MSDFCRARNEGADAVCSRRDGHDDHHCDSTECYAWTDDGEVRCLTYDHGQPPSRAVRRGNKLYPTSSKNDPRYRPGRTRPY